MADFDDIIIENPAYFCGYYHLTLKNWISEEVVHEGVLHRILDCREQSDIEGICSNE